MKIKVLNQLLSLSQYDKFPSFKFFDWDSLDMSVLRELERIFEVPVASITPHSTMYDELYVSVDMEMPINDNWKEYLTNEI